MKKKNLLCSLISAFLIRSYYEFRDAKRLSRKKAVKFQNNAICLYALACMIFGEADFIQKDNLTTKEAFDLPDMIKT